MKYVMMMVGGLPVPVLFPSLLVHSVIAESVKSHYEKVQDTQVVARSAGSFVIDARGKPCIHGESTSLKLKPHEDDVHIISQYIVGMDAMAMATFNTIDPKQE